MNNQVIKAGDLVYAPTYSKKLLKVVKNLNRADHELRVFFTSDMYVDIHSDGKSSKYHLEPVVFLATKENKAKIEAFYGCELESLYVDG